MDKRRKHIIIGTAGHVDHGKTALIKALTGTDCDRLKEEKERGLTIDLGYAFLDFGDKGMVSFVDVPGHERLVRTMLAGAGAVQGALLLVAADDGVMPQTIEHFNIINLLGIRHGIVVLTKIDLADQDIQELVKADIAQLTKGTLFENVPIVSVSAITGEGVPALKEHLAVLVEQIEPPNAETYFRFPIDWKFGVTGIGTAVCGIALSGKAKVGDQLEALPLQRKARVRGIEAYGTSIGEVRAGELAALNLAGIELDEVHRGDVLCTPGFLQPTYMLDARLHLLPDSPVHLKNRTLVWLHLACAEVPGRVVLLDEENLAPGEEALVQFRLEKQLTAHYGDRFVIRRYSPPYTIGGGVIIDALPRKHKRYESSVLEELQIKESGSLKERVEQALLTSGPQPNTKLNLVRALNTMPVEIDKAMERLLTEGRAYYFGKEPQFLHIDWYEKIREAITKMLATFHAKQPFKLGMPREELRMKLSYKMGIDAYNHLLQSLIKEGKVEAINGKVKLSSHRIKLPSSYEKIKQELENIYRGNGLATPLPADALAKWSGHDAQIARDILEMLLDMGTLIRVDEKVFFHRQEVEKAKDMIAKHILAHGKLSLQDCRDLLGTSRKYSLPLLYYLDKTGLTRRVGDDRVLSGAKQKSQEGGC